jgi:hypothetical protein
LCDLAKKAQGRLRFIDASYIRVHHSGLNAKGGRAAQAIGLSRGGLTTKIHALVDGQGRALKLLLSAGNMADIAMAPALVAGLSGSQCTSTLGLCGSSDETYIRVKGK